MLHHQHHVGGMKPKDLSLAPFVRRPPLLYTALLSVSLELGSKVGSDSEMSWNLFSPISIGWK